MPELQLSSLSSLTTHSAPESERGRRRIPAWLMPIGLIAGFALVFGLLFGNRLLPATPVKVAPVITIRSDKPVAATSSIEVSSVAVVPPSSTLLFQASGWIEPDPFAISVSTLVNGIIEEVFVLEGEQVTKDQCLAKLIDEDAILNLAEVEARVETLKSEIAANDSRIPMAKYRRSGFSYSLAAEKSRLDELVDIYDRYRALPKGTVAGIDLVSARLKVEQQQANMAKAASEIPGVDAEVEMIKYETAAKKGALREAEVQVAKANLALERHTIKAPMDGIVLRLHAAPGRKRIMQMDDPKSAYIVELFNPEKLQARIDVPLTEAAALSVGQPVELTTDLLQNLVLKGVVTRITGEADLQRNTLQVKVGVKNPDSRLRPEMLVRAKFFPIPTPVSEKGVIQSQMNPGGRLSIYVPEAAIFGAGQVWVVTPGGTSVLRSLSLGVEKREDYQLALEGVLSGERVILPPHNNLKPNKRIKILP